MDGDKRRIVWTKSHGRGLEGLVFVVTAMPQCGAISCSCRSFVHDGVYDSRWDSVTACVKIHNQLLSVKSNVRCACMVNDWISSYEAVCANNTIT